MRIEMASLIVALAFLVGCDPSIPRVSQQEKGFGRSERRLSSYESLGFLLARDASGGHSGGTDEPPQPRQRTPP